MKNVVEFKVNIPQSDLDELKARLMNTRWPGEEAGSDWAFGTSEAYLKKLVAHWTTNYDWRKQEAALNKYPQYVAEVDGIKIHFHILKEVAKTASP